MGGLAGLALIGTAIFFLFTKVIRPWREGYEKGDAAELDNDRERRPELEGKHGVQEIDGDANGYYGAEVEGKSFPGHEIDGVASPGQELDGGSSPATELPAREAPAAELP